MNKCSCVRQMPVLERRLDRASLDLNFYLCEQAGNKYISLSEFCWQTYLFYWSYCAFSVGKKPTRCHFCVILYFSFTSSSTCFGEPCAHLQELTTA